jgi:hypothetical protein
MLRLEGNKLIDKENGILWVPGMGLLGTQQWLVQCPERAEVGQIMVVPDDLIGVSDPTLPGVPAWPAKLVVTSTRPAPKGTGCFQHIDTHKMTCVAADPSQDEDNN